MSRKTDSDRSRLKARALGSRQRNRSRPYGQPSAATVGRKGVLGRVVDLLTPSFWLSKVRSQRQSNETEDRTDTVDETQESDEETEEQTESVGRSESSELESEDRTHGSFIPVDIHQLVDEERPKQALDESQRRDQEEEVHQKAPSDCLDLKLVNDSPRELESMSVGHRSGLHGSSRHGDRKATPAYVNLITHTQPDTQTDTQSKSASKRNRPMFSIDSFHSPTSSRMTRSPFQSTFYPGRIMFGGASAARTLSCKRIRQEEEFIEPVRKKIKAKNAVSSQSSVSVHSETAKRILETLDRMSSPLEDVRRIPSSAMSGNASPLSFTPTSEYPPPVNPLSRRQPSFHLLTAPPVEPLVSSHITNTFPTPQQSPEPQEVAEIPQYLLMPLFPSHTTRAASVVASKPSVAEGMTSAKTGMSPMFRTTSVSMTSPTMSPHGTVSRGSSAGKMRGEKRTGHYRKQSEDEEEESVPQPDLPDIPLPLGNSLPIFNFTPMRSVASDTVSTSITFHFSKPAVKTANSKQETVSSQGDISFHFSHPNSPVKGRAQSISDVGSSLASQANMAPLTAAMFNKPGSWKCDTCLVSYPPEVNKCKACDLPKQQKGKQTSNAETSSSSALPVNSVARPPLIAAMFVKPNSWTCDTCWVSNPSDVSVCRACQAARSDNREKRPSTDTSTLLKRTTVSSSSSTSSAMKISPTASDTKTSSTATNASLQLTAAMFRKPNSWECDVCLIPNSPDATKCKACQATKPGTATQTTSVAPPLLAAMFAKPNSWRCDTCLVSNPSDVTKCRACEVPKPGASQAAGTSSTAPFSALQSSKVGFWTCDTCLAANRPDVDQCKACQAVRPDGLSSAGQTEGFGTKIAQSSDGNEKQSQSTGGFKLTGVLLGKSTSNESSSTRTSSVGFKIPSMGSMAGSLSGGFKLPSGTVVSEGAVSGGFKLGSGTSLTGGFVVGGFKVTDGSREVGGSSLQFASLGGKADVSSGPEEKKVASGAMSVCGGLNVARTDCESVKGGSSLQTTVPSVESKDPSPAREDKLPVPDTECHADTGQVTPPQDVNRQSGSKPVSIADLAASGKLTVESAVNEHREANSKPLTFGLRRGGETKLVTDKQSESLSAHKESMSEKPRGFQLNAPSVGMMGTTEPETDRPGVLTESVGKGFQVTIPRQSSTSSGLSAGTHTFGLKVPFGQLDTMATSQLSSFPSTSSQTAGSTGFKLQFSHPAAASTGHLVSAPDSWDKQLPGVKGTLGQPVLKVTADPKLFSFGKSGIPDSSSSTPFQLSTSAQNRLFGAGKSDQSCIESRTQSHESHEFGTKSVSVQLSGSLSSKLHESGKSGQLTPTFNFGPQQKSSQEPQPAMFGSVIGPTLQTSGLQKGSGISGKPSFSFNLGQSKGPEKKPAFGSLGSLAPTTTTHSSQLFGQQQQNALMGQPLPSTTGQPFPFGFTQNQSPATFQFGAQDQTSGLPSGGSSGLLSTNPFSFPQPGVSNATSDPSIGMEDDTSGGFSQQQNTGAYDFSSSLQPSSTFSFAFSGDSSGPPNPFTNQPSTASMSNPSPGGSGRRTKQAVRRLPKKR